MVKFKRQNTKYLLKIIPILFFMLGSYTSNAQENEYIIKKISKTSAILINNGKVIDSVTTTGIKNRNTFIHVNNKHIYTFDFIVPGVGSVGNSYISIKKWDIVNKKMKSKRMKFIFGYCKLNRLKFKIKDDGIHWCYKKSIFKKLKGIITDNDIENLKNFRFNCE